MLDTIAKTLLLDMPDEDFCENLLALLDRPSTPEEPATRLLWEPWVLQRLQLIRSRASHLYFGVFLGPLRKLHPRLVMPGELAQAMLESSAAGVDGLAGDVSALDFMSAAQEMFVHGLPRGARTGWPALDAHYTVRRGELSIVTGIGSHMKSTWLQNLCVNLAREEWVFGIFSPEHAPLGLLSSLLVQQYTGFALSSPVFQEPGTFEKAMQWVCEHFHVIQPPEETQPTVPWLLAVARAQVERYGLDGLVLDPWNTIDHLYGAMSETQYISGALEQLRRFARAQQVHVWVVAHPAKMHKATSGAYAGTYPPPTPYDIAGSAHWQNKADNCLSIWRDVDTDSARIQVHVQKVRNRAVGRPGLVELAYNGLYFGDITA